MALKSHSRVLITGDSFIEGVGGSNGGWAQRLVRSTAEITIDVRGIGGHTSDDLVRRVDDELAGKPTLVIVGIGINDARWRPSLAGHDVPISRFARNISAIAAAVTTAGAESVFIGLTSVDEALTTPYKPDKFHHNVHSARYDATLRSVVGDHGARYVSGPDLAAVPDALADGLHPSDIGHDLILSAIEAELKT